MIEHLASEISIPEEKLPLPEGQCCGKCSFYNSLGECRRNPPQLIAIHSIAEVEMKDIQRGLIVVKPQLQVRAQAFFPMMKAEDYGCGEYKEI